MPHSFLDPTMHTRKGCGDIGNDSWFYKLRNHVTICIDCIGTCAGCHENVSKTNKVLQCPRTLLEGGVWEQLETPSIGTHASARACAIWS